MYARQLAEHYSGSVRHGQGTSRGPAPRTDYEEEREHSFFDGVQALLTVLFLGLLTPYR
jgi:hypothetical protein